MNDALQQKTISTISPLKNRADFLRLNKSPQKWISKNLIIQATPIPDDDNKSPTDIRVGITITKKIFKSAVKRNRVKRRLRALARDIIASQAQSRYDYVLIGRHTTIDATYTTLQKDLSWCLRKMKLNQK